MTEFADPRRTRLRSDSPQYPMSPPVAHLLANTSVLLTRDGIVALAETIQGDFLAGYKQLLTIDRQIGGVGFHNVNRREGEWLTGAYRVEFRPIFRPIQYAFQMLVDEDLVWNARYIVQWSCAHVEDTIKYRFRIPSDLNASLGVLLTRRPAIARDLEPALLAWLLDLNRLVYRHSKHSVEELTLDRHRFTPADAIAVYLMCRWAGVKVLAPTGLFGNWMTPGEAARSMGEETTR